MEISEILKEHPEYPKMVDDAIDNLEIRFERTKYLLTQPVSDDNFNEAFQNFHEIIKVIPLLKNEITIPQIVRARPNYEGEMFTEQGQLSYNIACPKKIQLGRFNRKFEPLFYGALPVENSKVDYVMTSTLETCKELIDQDRPPKVQDLTISAWLVEKPFDIVNLCFNDKHLVKNLSLKESVDGYLKGINEHFTSRSSKFIKEFLFFYSDLSGQLCLDGKSYYVLTALFVAIRYYYKTTEKTRIYGLIYASAMTESEGLNIVLTRYAVDNFLKLDKVLIYRYLFEASTKTYMIYPCSKMAKVENGAFEITEFIPQGKKQK